MSQLTDENIIIECPECLNHHGEQGLTSMIAHIIETHPSYGPKEVEVYAKAWMEEAYEREEKWQREAAQ